VKELFLSGLAATCVSFSVSLDQFSSLSEQVSELERQMSSFSNPSRRIDAEIESQEELETPPGDRKSESLVRSTRRIANRPSVFHGRYR
jgi:hypothetical protein